MAMLIASVPLLAGMSSSQDVSSSRPGERASLLVSQLGDDRFAIRERATSQLIALGVSARAALEQGLASTDREIRYRSRTVLVIIRDLDFQQRLKDFAEASDVNRDYGLPGWRQFRELVGESRAAKPLFVGMYRAEAELMRVADKRPKEVGAAVDRRCLELRQSVQLLGIRNSTNSVAALLFLVGNKDVPLYRPTNSTLYFFCQQGDVAQAARSGPSRVALHKMLARWLLREQNVPLRDAMMLAMQHDIQEILPRARRTVRDPAVKAYERQYAILTIAKFGNQADVPELENLLDDPVVCAELRRRDVTVSVQIRDIALAALLHLDKRDFAEFAYPWLLRQPPYVFNPSTLGFENDVQRQIALGKWSKRREQGSGSGDQ